MPFPLEDIPHAEVILLVNGNMEETMPPIMRSGTTHNATHALVRVSCGCGNHTGADMGLLGKNVKIGHKMVDAVDVFVGG